jgi:hypothetical protein
MERLSHTISKLLGVCILLFISANASAAGEATGQSAAGANDIALSIEKTFKGYFADIDALLGDAALLEALSNRDKAKLQLVAETIAAKLPGSLKARIYPQGDEEPDYDNSPACGYACVDIALQAYSKPVPAEAIMHKSAEANIVLVRPVKAEDGNNLGVIVVQYPYSLIKDAMSSTAARKHFIELRQNVAGEKIPLFQQGDQSLRIESPQQELNINRTRWSIAVWQPKAIEVGEFKLQLPWLTIIGAIVIVLIVIVVVIAVIKKSGRSKAAQAFAEAEEDEESGRTIVFGGGAADVDVSEYLSQDDVTDIKRKQQEK